MKTFIILGDSITDCDRNRDDINSMGMGYPAVTAANIGILHPQKFRFINEGISGDRIVDVYARIKRDILNQKPDYLSILIGVNDVWHELNDENGVAAPKFEKIYSMLIEEIKEELPEIKIFLLEPFVTPGTGTDKYIDTFRSEIKLRSEAVQRIADKFDLTFIPLQKVFDEAMTKAPASYWTRDGVHPTAEGHGLIARELTAAVL